MVAEQRYTPAQIAKLKGHSKDFWLELIHKGELAASDERSPDSKVARYMIRLADVDTWIGSRRAVPKVTNTGPTTVRVKTNPGFTARQRDKRRQKAAVGR